MVKIDSMLDEQFDQLLEVENSTNFSNDDIEPNYDFDDENFDDEDIEIFLSLEEQKLNDEEMILSRLRNGNRFKF